MANINANSHSIKSWGSGPVNPGGGGAGLTYRMRATDTTLTEVVFWRSSQVDSAGADYGGPGPLVNVVVHKVLGS